MDQFLNKSLNVQQLRENASNVFFVPAVRPILQPPKFVSKPKENNFKIPTTTTTFKDVFGAVFTSNGLFRSSAKMATSTNRKLEPVPLKQSLSLGDIKLPQNLKPTEDKSITIQTLKQPSHTVPTLPLYKTTTQLTLQTPSQPQTPKPSIPIDLEPVPNEPDLPSKEYV